MWQDGNNKTTSGPAVSLLLNKVKLRITCNLFVIVCKQLQICCHLHSPKPWTQLTFRVQPFQWCCRKAISLQNDIGAWQPCFYTCLHPEYKRLATSWVESFIAKKTIAVVHTDLMQWKYICIYKLNSNYLLICIVAFTNLSESYWVQVGLWLFGYRLPPSSWPVQSPCDQKWSPRGQGCCTLPVPSTELPVF